MRHTLFISLRMTLLTLIVTGLVYPLTMTGLAQLLFSDRANGRFISDARGRLIGSELIGQGFSQPAYVQPRPSAAGTNGYDATSSGGSNLGPTSAALQRRATVAVSQLQRVNPQAPGRVPAELVTASASGLDPHVSPEAARWQLPRVALARHIDLERLQRVLEDHIEARDLGFLGEPRVNVLLLNLALDRQFGPPHG